MMAARPHHYGFAHRTLPRRLLSDEVGRTWMSLLAGPAGPILLRSVWDALGETLAPNERIPGDGFAATVHEAEGDRALVVLTLPPVVEELEAYFVALIAERDRPPSRYLTLERGSSFLTGEPETYIAALRPGGSRHAFGTGPEPDEAAFAQAVCDRTASGSSPGRPCVTSREARNDGTTRGARFGRAYVSVD